nr:transcription initiation factor TFIID subunit [Cryptomonas sp.]
MYSYLTNSNILCKKNLIDFLRHLFPLVNIDLRCEQFLNIKIIKLLKETVELACIAARHRNGQILQEKDIRFVFSQKKKDIFPKLNFLSSGGSKVKKRSNKKHLPKHKQNN